jgi:TrmH family RNA methyltransferase
MLPAAITSPTNPRVRQAALLRDAGARHRTGLTLVDGRRELSRALEAGIACAELFVSEAAREDDDVRPLLERALAAHAPVTPLGPRAFTRVAFGGRDEGVVGIVRFSAPALATVTFPPAQPLLVVEGVEKPGNLGAILRTVDAAGLGGLVVADPRTDVANPAVIRASLGTLFTVRLATASTAEVIAWCAAQQRRVVAATPAGRRAWHEADLTGSVAMLLGSEAHGLSNAWHDAAGADTIMLDSVSLPMRGRADSLNVSATAAVLAYESLRQETTHR